MAFAAPLALAATAIAGATEAYGAYESGQAQKSALNYQAQISKLNAQAANEQAVREIMDPIDVQTGIEYGREVSAQRAGEGAGNIGGLTPHRVQTSTQQYGQWQQQIVNANKMAKAHRLQTTATGESAQAGLYAYEGEAAATGGALAATGTLIGTAGNVSGKYVQMGQAYGTGSNVWAAIPTSGNFGIIPAG
jgi:hypothetical protein